MYKNMIIIYIDAIDTFYETFKENGKRGGEITRGETHRLIDEKIISLLELPPITEGIDTDNTIERYVWSGNGNILVLVAKYTCYIFLKVNGIYEYKSFVQVDTNITFSPDDKFVAVGTYLVPMN